jgi:hypothetical protein
MEKRVQSGKRGLARDLSGGVWYTRSHGTRHFMDFDERNVA